MSELGGAHLDAFARESPRLDHIFIWFGAAPPTPPSLPSLPTRTLGGCTPSNILHTRAWIYLLGGLFTLLKIL